ncbi:cupin [Methylomonas methanica]|uniref:Cupin n=1 Tax=Methylomonas methanica TaxID=421 RepID=A0A177MVC3_METMH|nr:cupin domain-containing protein [Methylomonas methanica]OAI09374.1 cupin [Methylomonas methanica]
MTESAFPIAAVADQVSPRARKSLYPQAILDVHGVRLEGREKRPLGELFCLQNFGVNLTRLAPGAISALSHAHSKQDEFIYILQGCPTLYTNAGLTPLSPGMCAGFKAGSGDAHRLINETASDVVYLEIGDRSAGDQVVYPDDDLQAAFVDNSFRFARKDGTPY